MPKSGILPAVLKRVGPKKLALRRLRFLRHELSQEAEKLSAKTRHMGLL